MRRTSPEFTNMYVICHKSDDGLHVPPCKIGIANQPEQRLRSLQTGSAKRLHLYSTIQMPRMIAVETERGILSTSEHKMVGEWITMEPKTALGTIKLWLLFAAEAFTDIPREQAWETIENSAWQADAA